MQLCFLSFEIICTSGSRIASPSAKIISSFELKCRYSPGWLIPTASVISRVEVPTYPCLEKSFADSIRILSLVPDGSVWLACIFLVCILVGADFDSGVLGILL